MERVSDELILKLRDPKFYLEHFCKIKGKTPGLIPFILNEPQKDLFNTLRKNNRVITLKARQIGFSTAIAGYFYHKTITTPGTTTALVAHKAEVAAEFLDKVKTFWRTSPESLRPKVHYNSRYEISFPGIDSKILVMSGDNVGRGFTVHNAHCVSGKTEVYLPGGMPILVKDLTPGDLIVNGNGGVSEVKKVLKKKNNQELLSISVVGASSDLVVTPDHQLFMRGAVTPPDRRRGVWVQAGEVSVGDRIGFPYRQIKNRIKKIDLSAYQTPGYEDRTYIPQNLLADFNLGKLAGWYLSEGTVIKTQKFNKIGSVVFSVHQKETEELRDLIKKIDPQLSVSVKFRSDSMSAQVIIYNVAISRWLHDTFGSLCYKKTIPEKIWNFPPDFVRGVVHGCVLGDGSTKDVKSIRITTTSPALATQLRRVCVALRYGHTSIQVSRNKTRYGIPTRDQYVVLLHGPANYKLRREMGLEKKYTDQRNEYRMKRSANINLGAHSWRRWTYHYWSKIKSIKPATHEEYVYDIVLGKEPHSFLTHAGVVHNCSEVAMWEKPEEMMLAIENAVPRTGQIVVESTPNGVSNLFHRMWSAKDNGYVKREYGWWWLYNEEEIEAIRKTVNDPRKFAQEYALEFLASGRQVFDPTLIRELQTGQLEVGEFFKSKDGSEHFVTQDDRGLVMFQKPVPGRFYVLGADVSEGVTGGDYSTASILDRTTGEQVAFFRGHVAADKFGLLLNKWGRFYNDALMVIEINGHGLTTVTTLKNNLYPNMYFRPVQFDKMSSQWSDRLGWRTTKLTRPLMIDDLQEALRDGSLIPRAPEVFNEMLTFIFDAANGMVCMRGYHDDSIFSLAIALQGFKVMHDKPLDQLDYNKYLPSNYSY